MVTRRRGVPPGLEDSFAATRRNGDELKGMLRLNRARALSQRGVARTLTVGNEAVAENRSRARAA
jgi:hypothetical protein